MAQMPKAVVDLVNDPMALKMLGTVDRSLNVELLPMATLTAVDDETLAFADTLPEKSKQNLEKVKKATAMVFKPPMFAYQVKGVFQGWQTSGPIYDKIVAAAKGKMKGISIKGVGTMRVLEIYSASPASAADKSMV